jgi:hypothetical protein
VKKALYVAISSSLHTIPVGYGNAQDRPWEGRPLCPSDARKSNGRNDGHEDMGMIVDYERQSKAAGIMLWSAWRHDAESAERN